MRSLNGFGDVMTHSVIDSRLYKQQLSEKVERLAAMLAPFAAPQLEVFESPTTHYRMRAEFRVWHEGNDLYYIMFDPDTREKIRMDDFPVASHLINTLMPAVLDYVRERPVLRQKMFQVEFLSSTNNQALISLLYHRQLDAQWEQQARDMKAHLQQFGDIELVGRARKQKVCIDKDWITETLTIENRL